MVFDFLLNFDTAGFEPHFPLFPIPLPSPRDFALDIEPRVNVPRFAPVDTDLSFCPVTLLQYGQYLLVVFGIFIARKPLDFPRAPSLKR